MHDVLRIDQRSSSLHTPPVELVLRRHSRDAVPLDDEAFVEGHDALVDAVPLGIGQPAGPHELAQHARLVRRRPRDVDEPVRSGRRVASCAKRCAQQRAGAIGAVSRNIRPHHLVGRIAQLRQQLATTDRVEQGDARSDVGGPVAGRRCREHLQRALPARDRNGALTLTPGTEQDKVVRKFVAFLGSSNFQQESLLEWYAQVQRTASAIRRIG